MVNKEVTLRERVAKLINDEVDWAEWGMGDEDGERIAEKILTLISKEIKKNRPKEIGWDKDNKDKRIRDMSETCAYGFNQALKEYDKSITESLK